MGNKMDLSIYLSENATHYLYCLHCIGSRCKAYYMRCILLGETKSGKVKIVVFGNRNWVGKEHVKQIKYVEKHRLFTINNN